MGKNKIQKIAIIKTIIVLFVMFMGIFYPIDLICSMTVSILIIIISFFFGIIFSPLLEYNSYNHLIIIKPKWTDTFNVKKQLGIIQFIAFLLLSYGIGSLLGGLLQMNKINLIGTFFLACGFGMLIGMYLTLWVKKKEIKIPKK